MRSSRVALTFSLSLCLVLGLVLTTGCTSKDGGDDGGSTSVVGYDFPVEAGKYTVLGILTDNKDHSRAKANAEDTLSKYPDVAGMVGLWAYNPPAILLAVKAVQKEGKIRIVGFDEHPETLQAIAEGHIHGTIVQQPFLFGYRSVEYLSAMARGQEVDVPANKMIYVPYEVIERDNVAAFNLRIQNMREGKATPPKHDREYDTSEKVTIGFLTNSVDPFWELAQRGCELAEPGFNAKCDFYMPPDGTVAEQKRYIEDRITTRCQGLAISPIDPENQGAIIDQACAVMNVITQDSDAPDTQRKFYIGTSNYLAGRAAGKLLIEALPEGGEVMIFVGKLEVLNAQERSKGLIDELMGKPVPPEFAGG